MSKVVFLMFLVLSFSAFSQSLLRINDKYMNIEIKDKKLYLDSIEVFEGNSERVLYEIFNNRFVIVSLFDEVNNELALSIEHLGKNEIYVIDIENSKNIYKGQLKGITGKQILMIDLSKKQIIIKNFKGKQKKLKLTIQK